MDRVDRHHAQTVELLGRLHRTDLGRDGRARAARDEQANIFYPILDAVRAYATLGEICDIFRQEFGEHVDPAYL